jgi:hypothetical protein
MSKYTPLVQALESPDEDGSFNSVAKRLGFNPAAAYNTLAKVRPDLLGPRSARLGFAPVNMVLAGRSVKDVSQETGVPAPTLYQMAQKARKVAKVEPQPQPTDIKSLAHDVTAVELILSNIKQTAASMGTTPEQLCDLLKSQLKH